MDRPQTPGETSTLSANGKGNADTGGSDANTSRKQGTAAAELKSRRFNRTTVRFRTTCRLIGFVTLFLCTFSLGWFSGSKTYRVLNSLSELPQDIMLSRVVDQIISIESGGDPNKKNSLSSATGLAQFLDQTWLELIAVHRRDLLQQYSQTQILEMRRDPDLARDITARSVQQNALSLQRRNLPVTAGTLYLAHFAGPAGAIAILSSSDNENAASIMASADMSGRITPKKLVTANPFLSEFTVADLKHWADRKMGSPVTKTSFIQRLAGRLMSI
jgi:hypothetical protein